MNSLLQSGGLAKEVPGRGVIESAQYAGQAQTEATRETTTMERAAQMLVEQRERVSALVYELEKRLSSILRQVPPASAGTNAQQQMKPNTSALVEGLFNQALLTKQICDHLESVIDRIDL